MMHETMGSGMSWAMGVGAILVLAIVLLLTRRSSNIRSCGETSNGSMRLLDTF